MLFYLAAFDCGGGDSGDCRFAAEERKEFAGREKDVKKEIPRNCSACGNGGFLFRGG